MDQVRKCAKCAANSNTHIIYMRPCETCREIALVCRDHKSHPNCADCVKKNQYKNRMMFAR